MKCGNLSAVCDKNPWLGNYLEYPDYDYGYTFEELANMETLMDRMEHGNWSIRTGFIYESLAFVQQVNGGDEWLTLRKTAPGEWESFESISMEHILRSRGEDDFAEYVGKLAEEHGLPVLFNGEYVPDYETIQQFFELPNAKTRADAYIGGGFQCDETGGYPTVLCCNIGEGIAWIEPEPAYNDDSDACRDCLEACREWGICPCETWEEYNELLSGLGPDAYHNAAVEFEDQESGGTEHVLTNKAKLFCPVQGYYFPDMTLDALDEVEDRYEDWFLDDHETEDTAFLCEDANAAYHLKLCIPSDSDELAGRITAATAEFVEINGRLWVSVELNLAAETELDCLRDYTAGEMEAFCYEGGWEFQRGSDLYLLFPQPDMAYNQTTCAAPAYSVNMIMTEEEALRFPDLDDEFFDRQVMDGMGGLA